MGAELTDLRAGDAVAADSGERLMKEVKNLLNPDGGLPTFGVREVVAALPPPTDCDL